MCIWIFSVSLSINVLHEAFELMFYREPVEQKKKKQRTIALLEIFFTIGSG
jgi:hypothetical protein